MSEEGSQLVDVGKWLVGDFFDTSEKIVKSHCIRLEDYLGVTSELLKVLIVEEHVLCLVTFKMSFSVLENDISIALEESILRGVSLIGIETEYH